MDYNIASAMTGAYTCCTERSLKEPSEVLGAAERFLERWNRAEAFSSVRCATHQRTRCMMRSVKGKGARSMLWVCP